ncbi:MAG: hypothetical protein A2Z72_03215 [Omnitrophica bacterium RBG_13_46_9]|nr:MAG: hypothetical protein A2Z72_03215 [Omnitrophica bacterium RBG_13_46_9]
MGKGLREAYREEIAFQFPVYTYRNRQYRKEVDMVKKFLILSLFCLLAMSQSAKAEDSEPIQLAIFNPIQIVPETDSINGARLSLFYTVNKDVSGLSLVWLGVNRATGDVKGVEIGLGNWVEGSSYGLQAGLLNHAGKRFVGLQYGAVNITEGDFTGIQWGFVNWTEGFMHGSRCGVVNISKGQSAGADLGIVNYNDGSFNGFQGGFFNYAAEMRGVQLGLVNYTKSLNGLQIGLGNYNGNKEPLEFMVLVNWSF